MRCHCVFSALTVIFLLHCDLWKVPVENYRRTKKMWRKEAGAGFTTDYTTKENTVQGCSAAAGRCINTLAFTLGWYCKCAMPCFFLFWSCTWLACVYFCPSPRCGLSQKSHLSSHSLPWTKHNSWLFALLWWPFCQAVLSCPSRYALQPDSISVQHYFGDSLLRSQGKR